MPMLTFLEPGPSMMPRPEFPSKLLLACVVLENAAGLNHCDTTSLRGRFGSRNGLPIRSARSVLLPSKLRSLPALTVRGVPLRRLVITDSDQPPAMDRTTLGVLLK